MSNITENSSSLALAIEELIESQNLEFKTNSMLNTLLETTSGTDVAIQKIRDKILLCKKDVEEKMRIVERLKKERWDIIQSNKRET